MYTTRALQCSHAPRSVGMSADGPGEANGARGAAPPEHDTWLSCTLRSATLGSSRAPYLTNGHMCV